MGTLAKSEPSNLTLVERLKARKNQYALLLDLSGSMASSLEPQQTKYEALCGIVQRLQSPVEIFAFNTSTTKVTRDSIPRPSGGTIMSQALRFVKSLNIKKVIMVTDGNDADYDKQVALEEAKDMELKIMYVGPDPKPAFLDQLATNGFCTSEDLKQPTVLSEKLRLLIDGEVNRSIQL